MTNLLQLTINVQKPHRQTQCTLQLVFEYRLICERAVRLLYTPFFRKHLCSSLTNKNVTGRGLQIQTPVSLSVTIQNQHTFTWKLILTLTTNTISQNTDLSCWMTLYSLAHFVILMALPQHIT